MNLTMFSKIRVRGGSPAATRSYGAAGAILPAYALSSSILRTLNCPRGRRVCGRAPASGRAKISASAQGAATRAGKACWGYRLGIGLRAATSISALAIVGCGSGGTSSAKRHPVTISAAIPPAHPHAVEPVAGDAAAIRVQSEQPPGSVLPSNDPPPTGPASVTKAPAKGAPTDAEVRAAIARFQLAVARYHLDRLDFSHTLLDPSQLPPGQYNVSIASVFTDYGRPIACGGVLEVPELGVANKTLPCGTEVIFVYAGRAIRVPVIDRGPYIPGREWDLTGATAEALHFPGLGAIQWRLG
jgi:Lytic transglycolase